MSNTSDTLEQTYPDLFYHYTDQAGLQGIFESKSIWATHIRYLEDKSEFKIGLEMYGQCIEESESSGEIEKTVRTMYPDIQESLVEEASKSVEEDLRKCLEPLEQWDVFVTSFFGPKLDPCKEIRDVGDDLGQWTEYSGDSGGFAIGFDVAELRRQIEAVPESDSSGLIFETCLYDKATYKPEYDQIVPQLLKIQIEFLTKMSEPSPAISELRKLNMSQNLEVIESLVCMILRTKREAFRSEHEWRIVRVQMRGKEKACFRPGKSGLIPYVPIPLAEGRLLRSLIKRIVVGPSATKDDSVRAVQMLVDSADDPRGELTNCDRIQVVPSKIPYRNW